jgi:hypothetical protein
VKIETGATYTSGHWGTWLPLARAKEGKTSWLIAQALGCFPGQTKGAIVDAPQNLHVISFDEAALRGVKGFLLETCKAPKEALNFKVYNMEQDFKMATMTKGDYDRTFYNSVIQLADQIRQQVKGTPVLMLSSLTSLAEAVCRSTIGPAGEKKGAGGDKSKWPDFALQMTELRNHVQGFPGHVMWEGHVYQVPPKDGQTEMDETMQIPGRTGVNFPANVAFPVRVRRAFGKKIAGTNADDVYLDTRASFSFALCGRAFTERLQPQERDLTDVFLKLDLKCGHWGQKTKLKTAP